MSFRDVLIRTAASVAYVAVKRKWEELRDSPAGDVARAVEQKLRVARARGEVLSPEDVVRVVVEEIPAAQRRREGGGGASS